MQPAAAPTNGYLTVDLMRFLAAVTVVWAHVWGVLTPFDDTATGVWKAVYISAGFGQDAVRVFFIISGYWITASIMRKIVDLPAPEEPSSETNDPLWILSETSSTALNVP